MCLEGSTQMNIPKLLIIIITNNIINLLYIYFDFQKDPVLATVSTELHAFSSVANY